ncbi:MAG: BatD family protein [Candidatus Omnitrophota bacterium]
MRRRIMEFDPNIRFFENTVRRPLKKYRFVLLFLPLAIAAIVSAYSLAQTQPLADTSGSEKANLEITVRTEGPFPEKVYAQSPFEWRIAIRWFGEMQKVSPSLKKPPAFDGLQVLAPSTTIRTGSEDGRRYSDMIFSYRLMANAEGEAHIGSAVVAYTIAGEETEQTIPTASTAITAAPVPFRWEPFLKKIVKNSYFWGIAIVLIFILACVTLIYRKRSRKSLVSQDAEEKTDPVEEMFEAARRRRIEGEIPNCIRTLEQAVWIRFQERFPAERREQLITYLDLVEQELQPVLKRFGERCEEMKYAPSAPSPDALDRIWDDAKRLAGK